MYSRKITEVISALGAIFTPNSMPFRGPFGISKISKVLRSVKMSRRHRASAAALVHTTRLWCLALRLTGKGRSLSPTSVVRMVNRSFFQPGHCFQFRPGSRRIQDRFPWHEFSKYQWIEADTLTVFGGTGLLAERSTGRQLLLPDNLWQLPTTPGNNLLDIFSLKRKISFRFG
jgi:hypothetical protein